MSLKPLLARAVLFLIRSSSGRGPRHTMPRADWLRRRFQTEIRCMRALGFVAGLRFRPAHLSLCRAGAHLAGCWRIADSPAFPPMDCEQRNGCSCSLEWLFDYEASRIALWQTTRS